MIDCIYQGEECGHGVRQCCGGKEVREVVRRCLCQDEHARFCIASESKPSLVALETDMGVEIVHVAFCGRCMHRVRPA